MASGVESLPRSCDVPPADWCLLFDAVTDRLRDCARDLPGSALQAIVEDCTQSLDLLRLAIDEERAGQRLVDVQLQDARALLEAAEVELSDARTSERQARHLSQHDGLTELPNRHHFQRRVDDALSAGQATTHSLAVLFVDLDDFKPVNDRHGHDTGDELLRIVARRLSRSVREGDLVCRLGGDEFACLLPSPMGHEQLSRLACQLFDAVSAPMALGAVQVSVRPSIGIAVFPDDGDSTSTLLQRADAAMYHAKRLQLGFAFASGTMGVHDSDRGEAAWSPALAQAARSGGRGNDSGLEHRT